MKPMTGSGARTVTSSVRMSWYVDSLGLDEESAQELQRNADLDRARALVSAGGRPRPVPTSS